MLNDKLISSLSEVPTPVLTVYLRTQADESSRHPLVPQHLTWLKKAARQHFRALSSEDQELFQKQLRRVEKFLMHRHAQERSLVLLSGAQAWKLVPLQTQVENELHWGEPGLSQLLWLLDAHKPHCIAVVSATGARFFRFQLGEMLELGEKKFEIDISQWRKKELGHVTGQSVRKTRGSQRDVFEHRMEAQYARLCRETAAEAIVLCEKHGRDALFLVGRERFTGPVRAAFPTEFLERIVTIPKDLAKLSTQTLLGHLEPQITEWERQKESGLVDALIASQRGTVTGVDETLALMQKGKVRTVLLARELDADLRQCVNCGWTDRSADPRCSVCKGERRHVTLRQMLPALARSFYASIEIVSGEAAKRLKTAGAMGAWLREVMHASAK